MTLARVRQWFAPQPPLDFDTLVPRLLDLVRAALPPNAPVALAVGSRGIANLATIVRAAIAALRAFGARPFVLPAMGSHGGATPEGQTALLAEYGITEAALGVPIRSSMAVRRVGVTGNGLEVVCSAEALDAAGVLLINRIKPHTDFTGDLGSGLLKMLVVGLGKRVGAIQFHAASSRLGYQRVLEATARVLIEKVPLIGGLAIVENQRHETARLEIVLPPNLEAAEPRLCAEARRLMPRLPFDDIDLLIVDRMGKDLSGTGMDPAIIGRTIHGYSLAEIDHQPPPRIRRLFVRDLTPASNGNAIGLGLADFTTSRLVRAMDRHITAVNALTALSLQGAKIPLHFDTDREALSHALATLALPSPRDARVARIRDTLSVVDLDVSPALLAEVAGRDTIESSAAPQPLEFDAEGNLLPMAAAL